MTEPGQRLAVTLPEAAERLGLSLSSLRRHVLPNLKVIRVGAARLVSVAELSRWADDTGILGGHR